MTVTIFNDPNDVSVYQQKFIGLAPFLRMSVAGEDLRALCLALIVKAEQEIDNANLWMNLATLMFCLSQRELGLTIQAQALQMQRYYQLAAAKQPARIRLLMLLVPGDLEIGSESVRERL